MNKIKCLFGGIGSVLLAIAAIVALIAATSLPVVAKVFIGIFGVLAFAGAGALAYLYVKSMRGEEKLCEAFSTANVEELREKIRVIGEARTKRDTLLNNTENARHAHENAKAEYEAARAELSRVVMRWSDPGATTDSSYLNSLESRVRGFLEERARLTEEKMNVEIAVKEIRRSLSDKSEIDIRGQVSPLKRKVVSEINHQEILGSIEETQATIEEQQRLSFNVESELAELKLRVRDPGELYSKIQALDTKINELSTKHKAYFVALKAINGAEENLRAEISPRLGEYASEMLTVMTDRKYSFVGVDEGLGINFTTGDGEARSVDYLSGGTRDLTYVAVRMALIDMLYSEKPPICFDETFANQDNLRAAAMMRAVNKLAEEGHQSFVFTCRQREAALATELQPRSAIFKLSVTGD